MTQPGSRKELGRTETAKRRLHISNHLTNPHTRGHLVNSLSYTPNTEQFERAKMLLRTKTTVVVADAF